MAEWIAPETRFWGFVIVDDGNEGCWPWGGARTPDGYGTFTLSDGRKRNVRAHRWAYEHFVGPIPAGLQLDHLCRRRDCVNPAHLEPVTNRENVMRGLRHTSPATHCKRGHEFTPENTRVDKRGSRQCRACHRERSRAYGARLRSILSPNRSAEASFVG